MVVCVKNNGKPRQTVDFQLLNAHILRKTHHIQPPYHKVCSIPSNTKKTVSDTWSGYHSIPLHEENCHLMTLISPWGQHHYITLSQGYISSGGGYPCRFDDHHHPWFFYSEKHHGYSFMVWSCQAIDVCFQHDWSDVTISWTLETFYWDDKVIIKAYLTNLR